MSRSARWICLLPMLAVACVGVSERREARWRDPDEDGVPWPEDCDSQDPSVGTNEWYADLDGDGWGDAATYTRACEAPGEAYLALAGDCDDTDAQRHPNRAEACDGLDNDCDGLIDNNPAPGEPVESGFFDDDGDGYGGGEEETFCALPEGWAALGGDCDDAEAAVNPGASAVCDDGVDNDCDGLSDCGRWLEGEIDGAGDVRFVGDSYNTLQGAALVTDLSGDGLPDLVLGSREIDVGRNGGVFVLPSPLPTSGEVQIEPAAWLLNGDDTLNGEMGSALTVADLNFDAEVDLIMSAPGGEADPGRVYVAFGPLSGGLDLSSTGQTTHIIVEGRTAGDGFGQGAVAAQLDQDGQMDLLVTASGVKYTGVTTTYGALFLFLGPLKNDKAASSASQTLRLGSETTPEDLCLVSLGDLSGDGLDELAVGVNSWRVSDGSTKRSLESVLVLDGDLAGASAVEDVARWEVYALDSGDDLGAVILSAGDLDGDGRGELVVGAPNRDIIDTDAGTAWVFDGEQIVRLRGFSAAAEDTAIAEITGDAYTDQRVGAALAAPGDVDQDGRADLLVGAPGLPDYGGAFLLYGPVEGRIQAKDLDTTITAPKVLGADFGEGLGAPGDVNGLGHPDLLLYAPETFTWHLLFTDAL